MELLSPNDPEHFGGKAGALGYRGTIEVGKAFQLRKHFRRLFCMPLPIISNIDSGDLHWT